MGEAVLILRHTPFGVQVLILRMPLRGAQDERWESGAALTLSKHLIPVNRA
jgi:hypothetical protein